MRVCCISSLLSHNFWTKRLLKFESMIESLKILGSEVFLVRRQSLSGSCWGNGCNPSCTPVQPHKQAHVQAFLGSIPAYNPIEILAASRDVSCCSAQKEECAHGRCGLSTMVPDSDGCLREFPGAECREVRGLCCHGAEGIWRRLPLCFNCLCKTKSSL